MIAGNQVVQVARAVANGDGDWADVPRCVREAMVLALAGPHSRVAQTINVAALTGQTHTTGRRHRSPWPAPPPSDTHTDINHHNDNNNNNSSPPHPYQYSHCCPTKAIIPPSLTEAEIQGSVCTFEDAAWLRDQAVRSFAQFHNTIESAREAMRHHQRALWRTALRLEPTLVAAVRRELGLESTAEIPDEASLPPAALAKVNMLEALIAEVEAGLETLRAASLRLAANVLSDAEKRAMGLDPAHLPAEELTQQYTTTPVNTTQVISPPPLQPTHTCTTSSSAAPYQEQQHHHHHGNSNNNINTSMMTATSTTTSGGGGHPNRESVGHVPRALFEEYQLRNLQQKEVEEKENEDEEKKRPSKELKRKNSVPSCISDDSTLNELRQKYMNRIALMNEATFSQGVELSQARRRSSVASTVTTENESVNCLAPSSIDFRKHLL